MGRLIAIVLLLSLLLGCNLEIPEADKKFGTQHFASAVATIELHKLRNGAYPESLKDLEFLGDWDAIWISTVRYELNGDGYNLYLERGWIGKASLEFPVKFKQGLGIKESNVRWAESQTTL